MQIPKQFENFNFVLISKNDKKPFEKAWTSKQYNYNDPVLLEHLRNGGNYGVRGGSSSFVSIDGKTYSLIIIDFDTKEFQNKVLPLFPETFTTTSGSEKNCFHLWFASDNEKSFKILDENKETLCDVIGEGKQIIGVGSKHPSGSTYSIVKDLPFAFMPYSEIEALLKPHDKSPKKKEKAKLLPKIKSFNSDVAEEIVRDVSMESVLEECGVDISKNPTNCPLHSSNGGKCLSWGDAVLHCFHCDGGWNKFSFIRDVLNKTNKETFEWFAAKTGREDDLKKARKEFAKENPAFKIFTREGQAEHFNKIQPIFYDKAKNFWIWNLDEYKWEITDEVEILNMVNSETGIDIINSKSRTEIINSLKQQGRKNTPKPIESSWVQFKDKVYDVKTRDSFTASHEYLVRNPLPWKVGSSEDTPTIDKLFSEWVAPEYIPTLYQIMAYAIVPDRFMQRIIALVGGGSNGKGTFTKLLYKFLGEDNCVSSDLKLISENQFETAVLYGKLLVVFGEVSYDDLRNTNTLKQMAGEDKLRFCFKGKTPFTDKNTALGICLTNSLPTTPDRSIGFYRKWLIVDFPNQFKGVKQNLIDAIPDIEFENLAKKCLRILKELYVIPEFDNEGNFEQRILKYEERSNPVMKFLEEKYEEEAGSFTPLREFTNCCNEWLKTKHLRILTAEQIGKVLRKEGFVVSPRKIDEASVKCVLNLKLLPKLPKLPKSEIENTRSVLIKKMGSSGSSGSNSTELEQDEQEILDDFEEDMYK